MPMMGMKGGGKAFPDLTGDGKVDKKDILKGRGVPGFQEGGQTKSDRQMMAESERGSGKMPSDQDMKMIRRYLEERGITAKNFMDKFMGEKS